MGQKHVHVATCKHEFIIPEACNNSETLPSYVSIYLPSSLNNTGLRLYAKSDNPNLMVAYFSLGQKHGQYQAI